jgi:hypothetical protein
MGVPLTSAAAGSGTYLTHHLSLKGSVEKFASISLSSWRASAVCLRRSEMRS